jgi:two-component system, response regulator PdtaR
MSEISILIAEDDIIIAMDLEQILKSWKYNVKIVSSGEEAVKESIENKPDLILMDINLKGMNGIEAAKKIKKLSIPIIFISGSNYENSLKTVETSMHAYLSKPFEEEILQNEITSALKGCKIC